MSLDSNLGPELSLQHHILFLRSLNKPVSKYEELVCWNLLGLATRFEVEIFYW